MNESITIPLKRLPWWLSGSKLKFTANKPSIHLQGGSVKTKMAWTVVGSHISGDYWTACGCDLGGISVKTFRYHHQARKYAKQLDKIVGTSHVAVPVKITWELYPNDS